MIKFSYQDNTYCMICAAICYTCFGTVCWSIGLFPTLLIMQILCVTWVSIAVLWLGITDKLPWNDKQNQFYQKWVLWIIKDCRSLYDININTKILTKSQDRMLRLCLFNKLLLETDDIGCRTDKKLQTFLHHKHNKLYKQVSYNDLRTHCSQIPLGKSSSGDKHPHFLKAFYYELNLILRFFYLIFLCTFCFPFLKYK